MKRVLLFAGLLIFVLGPVGASAQGLLGGNWTGLGASLLGGSWSCGPRCNGPVFYVGYTYDPGNSAGLDADTRDGAVLGAYAFAQQYGVRGVWLGLSQTVPVSESVGIIASGWYLLPAATSDSQEPYNYSATVGRLWSSLKTEWWYGEALAAFGSLNGFSLLGGFRYDHFSTELGSPIRPSGVASSSSDRADVTSNSYIPLVGAQMAYGGPSHSLLLRVVGFPALMGRVKYSETFGLAGTNMDASGNYKGTNFVEFFADYGYRVSERASLGLFGKFSSTRGSSDLTIEGHPLLGSEPFSVTVGRNSWTAGGRLSMEF